MISMRMLILSYTIQLVVSNVCTKFQNPGCTCSSSCEIFDTNALHWSERSNKENWEKGKNKLKHDITKTYLYNFHPLKPHFYIVKLVYMGYTLFFLFLLKTIDCGYSLEPPRRGGSNEYHNLCFEQKCKKISEFLSEYFHIFVVKLSVYLNTRVFVMMVVLYTVYVNPL